MKDNNARGSLFTFAFVIKADTDAIDSVRDFLEKHDIIICYQKLSGNKLYITEREVW